MSSNARPNSKPRPWQQGSEEPVSFGTWLRRQREVREISLREIADSSKISLRYLEAFEQDRFDILPAGVFSRGFLREYAKYVGLDPDEVVNHFLGAKRALEPQEEEEEVEPQDRGTLRWVRILLLLVAAAVAVAALVTFLAFENERSRRRRSELPEASGVEAPASGGGDEAPAEDAPGLPEQESGGPGSAADPSPSAAPGSSASPGAQGPPAAVAARSSPPAAAAPLLVTLDFSSSCWVDIRVDGSERIREERSPQASPLVLEARESVELLKVGDVSAVEVRVNGERLVLGDRPGQVVGDIRIDLETARRLAEGS